MQPTIELRIADLRRFARFVGNVALARDVAVLDSLQENGRATEQDVLDVEEAARRLGYRGADNLTVEL